MEIVHKNIMPEPERQESLEINLQFYADSLDGRQRDMLRAFFKPLLQDGDKLNLSWAVDIFYFGTVVSRLSAIEELLDCADVISVKTEELKTGKSVIQNVLCKLEQIEQKLRVRESSGKDTDR